MEMEGGKEEFSCMHIFLHKYITPVGYQFSSEGRRDAKKGGEKNDARGSRIKMPMRAYFEFYISFVEAVNIQMRRSIDRYLYVVVCVSGMEK